MRIYTKRNSCLGFLLLLGCANSTDQSVELSGPTDKAMLDRVVRAISSGKRSFIINSRGGRESIALDIADHIFRSQSSIIVRRSCTSSCAQYILPAAKHIYIEKRSIVLFHANSTGIISLDFDLKKKMSMLKEMENNVRRSKILYDRNGVDKKLLSDATYFVEPNCMKVTDTEEKIFTKYDYWMPTKEYLETVNFKFDGYWPDSVSEAKALYSYFYGYSKRDKLIFSDRTKYLKNKIVPKCS